ncbi:uncharacterized protein LOC130725317 [Lotus japonicus]|uniref:uncharacterized protein LOC130725317 n=1 Tax=Lotus japonicus TaxID=34305 RepID=UPI00258844DE|nr:uncharacterized protein LOC130725317 [Lotus japonicus]
MDRGKSDTMNLDWEKELRKFQKVMASWTKPLKMKAMVKLTRFSKHALEHVLSRTIPILMRNDAHYIPNDLSPSLSEVVAYCLKCISCTGDGTLESVAFVLMVRRDAADHDRLEIVIDLLDSHINCIVRRYLPEMLTVLALWEDIRRKLTTLGALHLLVEVAGTGSMVYRERACQKIELLGITEDVMHELVELGVIPVLVELMRDGDQCTKLIASLAIKL